MITSFNPIGFKTQDFEIQKALAKILVALMNANLHFIDIKSINAIFYNEKREYIFDSNVISTTYLSTNDRRGLKKVLNKKSQKPITSLHRQHLSYIVIGIDADNKGIHPIDAYRLITEWSKIIVENGINDWKFIKGICQKYSSGKTKRQSIYQILNQAIETSLIKILEKHFITQDMVNLYQQDKIDDFISKREIYLKLKERKFVEKIGITYTN